MMRPHPLGALSPAAAALLATCQAAPPIETMGEFDTCLITHMAAIDMLDEGALRDSVIASQTKLLSDDSMDESTLASRNSALLSYYAGGADAAISEAEAIGTAPQILAANAIFCMQELMQ